jgi:energy-coupling factor transporter ATP-binding protein EcfA2
MTDNGNEQRPVRKLTVDNFSVIKHAELEFGKITVLIGPQASGKSLLCKLAHFLGREAPDLGIERVAGRYLYEEFVDSVEKEFSKWFPPMGWGSGNWSISFTTNDYSIAVSPSLASDSLPKASMTFGDAFKEAYVDRLIKTAGEQEKIGFVPPLEALRSLAALSLRRLQGRGVWDAATYIPLERSFFVDTQKGYRALGTDPDPISARFAVVFANSLSPGFPKPRMPRFLNGDLIQGPDGPSVAFEDGRILPLNFLSSGSKETLPILSVLDFYEYQRRHSGGGLATEELYGERLYFFDDFTIEEPEASVFPSTQYDLVREFAALANEVGFKPHFAITTHSPYTLSSFNNLIYAGQLASQKPELKDEIARMVPERFWIENGSFRAYCIHDGELKSILSESGLIDGEYLDSVSDTIGNQFDSLLRLEYDHTEAS